MSIKLQVELLLTSLCLFSLIIYLIKTNKLTVKYSLTWLMISFLMLLMSLFPKISIGLAKILGFEAASNMIFLVIIGVLIIINISMSIIVSKQNKQIRLLVQDVSILRKSVENNQRK